MQKVYHANDYFLAFLVMLGCVLFILHPVKDCPLVLKISLISKFYFLQTF